MNEPDANRDSLQEETDKICLAESAEYCESLSDGQRMRLIRKLVSLKISAPIFALLVAAIVAPECGGAAMRPLAKPFRAA
ncbi:MAG: hypothetical protein A4E69_01042 [Syntrophus sp. PtaB.Bin138]|nr:hypothetical protein [Geobacteraceae bacterium]OPY14659.1 MAG: hypothetical protein A4E69_01042 [Syntrophus sp. PtaB.Bin138]